MNDRLWRGLLIFGVVVRVALALFTSNSNDLAYYALAAYDGAQRMPMYESASFAYPPLWGYFFEIAGRALVALHVPLMVHERALDGFVVPRMNAADLATPLAAFVLKLPAFLVDAALTELLYTCGLAYYGRAAARRLALSWWLNPLPIVVGGVQASWDSIVPFTMIFALLCVRQGRWSIGGGALATGIFAKLTPLYLIFLLPALLRAAGSARERVKATLAGLAGAGVIVALLLWPIVMWHELDALRVAIFERAGTFVLGGANLFAFAGLASAGPFNEWAATHRAEIGRSLTIASVLGCGAIGALCLRRTRFTLENAFVGMFGLLVILFLTSPFVQPTYIIWVLPFGLFLAAGGDRTWAAISWTLTAFALAFYLTVRAVQSLLEPACVFFNFCNPAHFGAASVRYAYSIGLGGSTLQVSLDVVFGELICITLLLGGAYCFDLLSRPETPDVVAPSVNVGMKRRAAVAAAVVVFACGLAVAPGPAASSVHVSIEGRRAVVSANGYDGDVHIVVGDAGRACTQIFAYGDDRYPSLRGITPTFTAGLPIHMRNGLRLRGVSIPVRTIDARGLAYLFHEAPAGRCVLVLGGVLPQIVRDAHRDLLKPWLLAGGVAFWAGGPFDVVVAHANGTPGDPLHVVASDWPELVGNRGTTVFPETSNAFAPPVRHATIASPAWATSRIGFDRTTFPLNAGPLQRLGGAPLAYVDGRFNSSVSSLPLGRGRLVFFGDAFDDELQAADTLAQLLYAGTWEDPRHLRVVSGAMREDGAPITLTNLRGGDSVRVFGERYGGGPFTSADVPGHVTVSFAGRNAIVASNGFSGGVFVDVRKPLPNAIRRLVVYRDDAYPTGRGAPIGFGRAVASSLRGDVELGARGVKIAEVDARGLRAELQSAPNGDALVLLGGVSPDTVRGRGFDLLKPWIERGGLAIWAGGPFDLLYARPGTQHFLDARLDPPDYGPWSNLYGRGKIFPARVDPYYPPRARGDRQTAAWPTWRGDFHGTTFALDTGALSVAGGAAIGFDDAHAKSSVSTLPIGRGRAVFFGDSFADPHEAADAVARLTLTGAWAGDWRAVRTSYGRLRPGAPPLTIPNVPAGSEAIVFGETHDDVTSAIQTKPEK